MDTEEILRKYRETTDKNLIIADADGKMIYESKKMDFPTDVVIGKIKTAPDDFEEQEFWDKEHDLYFSVKKVVITEGSEKYFCYRLEDISEYTLLVKEVASYTKSVSNMSKFQTSIMNKLSMSYDAFLSGLANYCSAEEVTMFVHKDGIVVRSTYKEDLERVVVNDPKEYEKYFAVQCGESLDGSLCIMNSALQGQKCVVLVKNAVTSGSVNPMDASIQNVIRLFIENCILRDKIVYESEHDKLTGLYNKGKYMALRKISFGKPNSIAIYNFDVNNLKHINDNYGHEYGDALIIKAAKSIAAVVSDNVFGFRMGGDEYVMVAVNVTENEAENIRARWKAALDKLNEEDKSMFCSMACGVATAAGEYDYDELYEKADKFMYENKKALKANNITSHIC
ncbi:MAG: GGDEF domain-containing protein [Ruminiclostridium sp.]|nr:GGDEF domain-containing protein [Ruminiclostridium sp.]